ncbi:hypothetical protein [Nostoc sp.]|uniref:hypothetical protein n=1 Tax=Nostoc sp. TaxID=1180 RepID=UPI002FFAFC45
MVRYKDSDSTLMANSISRVATTAIALVSGNDYNIKFRTYAHSTILGVLGSLGGSIN